VAPPKEMPHTPTVTGRSILVTVLFTDIVGSTEVAAEMGDRRWRELLARHHRLVRAELKRFGGKEIDTAGDGFFATFARPAQAVRCACAIVQAVRELGVEVRAGVHTGEAEVMGRTFGGMAVHTGARISGLAGPGEVLVSGTLRDLIPGATLSFDDRGRHVLKGVPGEHRILAVSAVDAAPLPPPLDGEGAAARRKSVVPPPPYRGRPALIGVGLGVLAALATLILLLRPDEQAPTPPATVREVAVMVDPAERSVEATVPLPPSGQALLEASQVAVGLGSVWIVNGECVCRIDPEIGAVDAIRVPYPAQIALGHRAAWVATLDNEIYPIEAAADEASDAILLTRQQIFHASVTTTENAVWAAFTNQLARIDPLRGTIERPIAVAHGTDDIIGVDDEFWVVDRLAKVLYLYNAAGRQLDSVQLQATPDDVVAGPRGELWVLNRSGGTVTRVDPDGRAGQPIRVTADPSDLAAGPDAVWVADQDGRSIQRIDPSLEQKDDPIRLPGPVSAVGVDPETGEVWAYLH
jgi:class 3 adenylate cyclase/streptogramin lyase